jgi:hypothetical protein
MYSTVRAFPIHAIFTATKGNCIAWDILVTFDGSEQFDPEEIKKHSRCRQFLFPLALEKALHEFYRCPS